MIKRILFSIHILASLCVFGSSLEEAEIKLSYLHNQLSLSEDDARSDSICDAMRQTWITTFEHAEVFDYPFDALKFCTLTSKDHHIRLLNWNLPYRDGTYKYFCFLLISLQI